MKQHPDAIVEVGSHTDSRSGYEFKKSLSNKRSKSVVSYLNQKGIEIDARPTTKITTEVYSKLLDEFETDKSKRDASQEISEEKRKEKERLREIQEQKEQERLQQQLEAQKEAEKEEFVRNLFLDLKRKATPGAITALVGALGNDLRELQSAIGQIAADAPAGTIDEVMIDKFHQGRVETTGFDVADATLEGNLPAALIALRSALETGTDPVMITSAIASSLRSLAKVSGANRAVKSFELAGQLGMAPWQIDKARRQLNRWTPAQIADAVGAIALADAQVKGAASDPIYALEKALTRIAQKG